MDSGSSERGATSSAPEDHFTELFTQLFGVDKALLLVRQFPVTDVYGFRPFYWDRRERGLLVERPGARKQAVDELDEVACQRLLLGKPSETFERRRFLRYDRDLAYVRFDPRLWRQLEPDDRKQLRESCQRSIETYYERIQSE